MEKVEVTVSGLAEELLNELVDSLTKSHGNEWTKEEVIWIAIHALHEKKIGGGKWLKK
ncbi:hypothetical protein [Alteribacter populi]|uniref:hypothetical protein n=1 Tax=Alteribacter populi TaxID=2011011 RepID=UPI0012FFBC36|nr:hypothetical protein [Alteribacter populi]